MYEIFWLQSPKHKIEWMDTGDKWLLVNESSWQPFEKTHSTVVDVTDPIIRLAITKYPRK